MFYFNDLMTQLKSILVIDDDSIHNYLCEMVFQKTGLSGKLRFASNGLKAIELLKDLAKNDQSSPDILIIDILMPIMDGFEFLRSLDEIPLKNKEYTSIYMTSASPKPKNFDQQIDRKISGFLLKPLTTETFEEILNNHINQAYTRN